MREQASDDVFSDEQYAYIVGYTPGGVPFGITWEELDGADGNDAARLHNDDDL